MRPALVLLLLFAFLFAATTESRKGPGEYWKMIMKDQEMPEGLQGLLPFQSNNNVKTQEQLVKGSKDNCEEPLVTSTQITIEKKLLTKDFDTKVGHKSEESQVNGDFEPRPSVTKYDDFKPRPSTTKYDFELRPSISKYGNFEPKQNTIEYDDFEPRPSVTKYDDFEPRPSVTKYDDFELKSSISKYDNFKPRPSVTKYNDFKPRPSVTKYDDFESKPNTSNSNSNSKYNDEIKNKDEVVECN